MAIPTQQALDRRQLQQALEHCVEAAALGGKVHQQLELVILGYDPNALTQLQNIHQRLSVVVARMCCAREQLDALLTVAAATPLGEVTP